MADSRSTFVQENPLRNYYPTWKYFECKETASNLPQMVEVTGGWNESLQKCLTVCNEKGLSECAYA